MFKKCLLLALSAFAQQAACGETVGRSLLVDCGTEVNPLLKAMIKCEDGSYTQEQCNESMKQFTAHVAVYADKSTDNRQSIYTLLPIGVDQKNYYSDSQKGLQVAEMYAADLAVLAGMPKALKGLDSQKYAFYNRDSNVGPKFNLLAMLVYAASMRVEAQKSVPFYSEIAPSINLDPAVVQELTEFLVEGINARGTFSYDESYVKILTNGKPALTVNTIPALCEKIPSPVCKYIKAHEALKMDFLKRGSGRNK